MLAFVAGQAIINQDHAGYSLSDPGALRVVLGAGVYLAMVGLLGGDRLDRAQYPLARWSPTSR